MGSRAVSGQANNDRLKRADCGPTGCASGKTGVRAIAVLPSRARNSLHRPEHAFIGTPANWRNAVTGRASREINCVDSTLDRGDRNPGWDALGLSDRHAPPRGSSNAERRKDGLLGARRHRGELRLPDDVSPPRRVVRRTRRDRHPPRKRQHWLQAFEWRAG